MCGNLDRRPIGKCSQCGGVGSIPTVFWSVNRPVARCERCGAIADETDRLPVIPTIPVPRERWEAKKQRRLGSLFEGKNWVETWGHVC